MKTYLDLVNLVLSEGALLPQRAVVDGKPVQCYTYPGAFLRLDLRKGFPLLTTKKIPFNLVAGELEFFIKGEHTKNDLWERGGNSIWDEWTAPNQSDSEELGPIYGVQWRRWLGVTAARIGDNPGEGFSITGAKEIDQLRDLVESLKKNPSDRRQIVTAWNPSEVHLQALPPCHMIWQTVVTKDAFGDKVLNLSLTMRSADMMLGVPFNIASYALLTHLIAKHVSMRPGILSITMNNCHIYEHHEPQVREQLAREPGDLPRLEIPDRDDGEAFDLFLWKYTQVKLLDYNPAKSIKMQVAV